MTDCESSEDIINCSFIKNEVSSQKQYVKVKYSDSSIISSYCESSGDACEESREESCEKPCKKRKNFHHPDVCMFKSIITPLSALTPVNSKFPGPIAFTMRRKNKVVSLQWEPFTGIITTTGISYLMLTQTIANMPAYPVFGVYNLEYNGVSRVVPIEVNPSNIKANVLFYLNSNGTSENVNANDSVSIRGGCFTWVVA
jgi:hypothetical protein